MILLREAPGVATRDCGHCLTTLYNAKNEPWLDAEGRERPRDHGVRPNCKACPKGPTPFVGGLSKRNEAVYLHYLECKAVGHFPDDPIVRRNARIIADAEAALDRVELLAHLERLGAARG